MAKVELKYSGSCYDTCIMKLDLKEDIFVSRLLEETCKVATSNESRDEGEALFDYFERKNSSLGLNLDLEEKDRLRTFECQFIEKISCFRIHVNGVELDFPKNWSFFKNVYSIYNSRKTDYIHISPENDKDDFLSVMLPFVDRAEELVFIVQKEKVFLSFLAD